MKQTVRIVIADDQGRTRQSLKAFFASAGQELQAEGMPGIEVIGEATNGEEAVRLAESTRPDMMLMDARMPVMDGLEATRQIKAQWPEVKVIVLTMHLVHRDAAREAGADAFLLKGGPAEELVNTIVDTVVRARPDQS